MLWHTSNCRNFFTWQISFMLKLLSTSPCMALRPLLQSFNNGVFFYDIWHICLTFQLSYQTTSGSFLFSNWTFDFRFSFPLPESALTALTVFDTWQTLLKNTWRIALVLSNGVLLDFDQLIDATGVSGFVFLSNWTGSHSSNTILFSQINAILILQWIQCGRVVVVVIL